MLDCAEIRILLIDHSEFGRKVMTKVCGLDLIDHLVVDEQPKGEVLHSIQTNGIRLHVADAPSDR